MDDRVSSMETLLVERMGSMEERLNIKFDRLADSITALSADNKKTQSQARIVLKSVRADNAKVLDSNRQLLVTIVMGFLAVVISVASLIAITR
nr:hypothetical protein [uncultured Dethiosulfovibrio sp.]